jgi:dTMP kinase
MLITFEGIDASGKSTQLELLGKNLHDQGFDVIITRQPGGTQIGQQIRKVILDPDNTDMIPETEVLLYMADRLQHISEVIKPALDAGKIVISDRYHDATTVYQGSGRELDLSWLKLIEDRFILKPDLTFWINISLAESQSRLEKRNQMQGIQNCRLESEGAQFFTRIIEAYDRLSKSEPERFANINGETRRSDIQTEILEILLPKLKVFQK